MRRKELSEFMDEEGQISLEDRIKASLRFGLGWYSDMQALDTAIEKLSSTLGPEHLALTNLELGDGSVILPIVLFSPQGVRVIVTSRLSGVYRAKGEDWLKYGGSGTQRFSPAKPNLIKSALRYAEILHSKLRELGYDIPHVEPVIIFTNPRTHIDSHSAATRIVQADAIERFASNLLQDQPLMDQDDIEELAGALTKQPEPEIQPEIEQAARVEPRSVAPIHLPEASDLEKEAFYASDRSALTPRKLRQLGLNRLPFSQRQTIVLGVLLFFEIIILSVAVIIVIANTFYG
jgi:hypothetical protein